jgi:hypothetical protein
MGRVAAEHNVSTDELFWRTIVLIAFVLFISGAMRLWVWWANRDPARVARNSRATFKALTTGWSWPLWLGVLAVTVVYFLITWAESWAWWAVAPVAGVIALLLLMLPGGSFRLVRRKQRRPRG